VKNLGAVSANLESTNLHDRFSRPFNSLRVSVTQRCNFDCFFCHREGEAPSSGEMTSKEIGEIAGVACKLGVKKVKLTGGEPLLREDITDIVSRISRHADEVSMTTNGSLLKESAAALRKAGLKRVNVSLHSVDPETFAKITGRDALQQVEEGIEAALKSHLEPVKINVVVFKGMNDYEIPQMIDFARSLGVILQLIEFQPVLRENKGAWHRFHYDLAETEGWLEKEAFKIENRALQARRKYFLRKDGKTTCVEVVRPMHNTSFCKNCTRLRVTSDGRLKPCLMRNDNLAEAATILRSGGGLDDLERVFRRVVELREPYWREGM